MLDPLQKEPQATLSSCLRFTLLRKVFADAKIQFKFEGIGYYDGYVHHINKLAEENGMSMKVVGTVLRETDLGVDQEFDLPDPQIFHSKMYKPLKIMLHCRIEF